MQRLADASYTYMPKASFIVDAAILQELGERLVGRPAIALGELVKNAYDADATICCIEFHADRIILTDNGHGMTDDDFIKRWMRLATTHKVDQRTSNSFHRPLTGSKGIGRLSAQFLADQLTLDSTPKTNGRGVHAEVDWRAIVPGSELKEFIVEWQRSSNTASYPVKSKHGTRIELRGLKSNWNAEALEELGNDVWMLRSPFKAPVKGGSATPRDVFNIEIEAPEIANAREAFDRTITTVFANWKARIRGQVAAGRAGGKATISIEFKKGYPAAANEARRFQITTALPVSSEHGVEPLIDRTSFEILIFKATGKQAGGVAVGDLREYLGRFGNVSVYDAGFRLPYYGSKKDKIGEDWLTIAADQGRRLSQSSLLPESLQTQNKYMLDLPAPGRIFGAVEIDTNHEKRVALKVHGNDDPVFLQIQSGRDRLHDNDAFYQLRDVVRYAIDYYANRYRVLKLEALETEAPREAPSAKLDRAVALLEENRPQISAAAYRVLSRELSAAAIGHKAAEEVANERAALLAPLASAGMTALALNHEIARESAFLGRIGRQLRQLATKYGIDELSELAKEFESTRRRIDSVRELFAPLLAAEDRSATDRLRVQVVIRQVVTGMAILMPGVRMHAADIPADLRFPLGSLAEWSSILQNILSNAWNAMLDTERREVLFTAGRDNSKEWLRLSDTGQGLGIPLSESHQLFEPFERRLEVSQDKRSIAIGGQGLGLAIVRMLASRRKVDVAFVAPPPGFSTAFELSWRRPKS